MRKQVDQEGGILRRTVVFLTVVLLYGVVKQSEAEETVLKAAIVGRKGKVNIDDYVSMAEALVVNGEKYCRVEFVALEYDTSNGSSVYNSLRNARETFNDSTIAVAIGPQIDVFTSTEYVIRNQIHLVTSSGDVSETASRTMPILPDPKTLSEAIAKFVKHMEWGKVAFLSQEDFSPVLALGNESVFVSPIRLPSEIEASDNPQLQQTLTTLRESQMDKFILHSMKKDVVKTVIKAAQKLHLLHHSISWFITYLDFDDIADDIQGMATLYGLQLLDKDRLPDAVNERFNTSVSRLQKGLMRDVIGILRHYLKEYVKECNVEPAQNYSMTADDFKFVIKNAVTPYKGALGEYIWDVKTMEKSSNTRSQYYIKVYRYQYKENPLHFATLRFDRKVINLSHMGTPGSPLVENAFKDKSFDVIAKQDKPFLMRKEDGSYEGFCVDVLHELSKRLNNFKYDIFELENNETRSNGTAMWEQIITQLKVGNASIAIGAFAVTAEREEKISFSYTIMSSSVSLLVRRPPETVNYFQFLGPFSTELWIMIVVSFLIVGLGLYFMGRFDSTQEGVEQKFDLKESMWYSLTVLLQGSTEYSPQTTCMRTIVAFFWFCTLVINAAYTANLAAFLTLQQIDNRIKTVDELARQTKIKYGVLNNSELMDFFEKSRVDPYERMWSFMTLHSDKELLVPTRDVGLRRVKKEAFAFLDDGVINNYLAQDNCEVESIEQNFGVKHFSIGFPKGAPFRGDINGALLALKEDGTLDKLRDKWWDVRSNCSRQTERSSTKAITASELDISNMFGVFIVLIVFTCLAIAYEIGTCFYKCYRGRQETKKAEDESSRSSGNNDTKEAVKEPNNIQQTQFGFQSENPLAVQ